MMLTYPQDKTHSQELQTVASATDVGTFTYKISTSDVNIQGCMQGIHTPKVAKIGLNN